MLRTLEHRIVKGGRATQPEPLHRTLNGSATLGAAGCLFELIQCFLQCARRAAAPAAVDAAVTEAVLVAHPLLQCFGRSFAEAAINGLAPIVVALALKEALQRALRL